MRKNRTLRVASLLLALTLITSCFVGSTFAKYTTADEGADTARVAKWGITVLVSGSLFGENYVPNSATDKKDMISATAQQSVDSQGEISGIRDIVAPGTKSDEGLILAVQGNPEVGYKVGYSTTGYTNEDIWLKAGDYAVLVETNAVVKDNCVGYYYESESGVYKKAETESDWGDNVQWYELHDATTVKENVNKTGIYYPVEWKVTKTGTTGSLNTSTYRTVSAMNEALAGEFSDEKQTGLNVKIDDVYEITWAWAFSGQQDGADTILGNLMSNDNSENYIVVVKNSTGEGQSETYGIVSAGTHYNLEIAFGAKITVEQVD